MNPLIILFVVYVISVIISMVLFALWDNWNDKKMDEAAYVSLIPLVNIVVSCTIVFVSLLFKVLEKLDEIDFTKSTFFLVKIYRAIRNSISGRKEQGE